MNSLMAFCRITRIQPRKILPLVLALLVLCLSLLESNQVVHADANFHDDPMVGVSTGPWLSADTLLNPVSVSWGKPRLDVFLVGSDRHLHHYWQNGGNLWHLEDWGGNLDPLTRISAVTWGVGRLDVFGVDDNGILQHFWQDGGTTFGPESWGGNSLTGTGWGFNAHPTAVSWGVGRLDVFLIGNDGSLDHLSQYAGEQPIPTALGGQFGDVFQAPQAVSWGFGRMDVFVIDAAGALWHYWEDGATNRSADAFYPDQGISGHWSRPTLLTVTAPVVTTWGPGRLDLFVINSLGALWHIWQDGGPGFGQEQIANGFHASLLTAASWNPGRLDVFVAGSDSSANLIHYGQAGGPGWNPPDVVGLAGYDIPSVVSWGAGRLDVFNVLNTENAPLKHYWYDN